MNIWFWLLILYACMTIICFYFIEWIIRDMKHRDYYSGLWSILVWVIFYGIPLIYFGLKALI